LNKPDEHFVAGKRQFFQPYGAVYLLLLNDIGGDAKRKDAQLFNAAIDRFKAVGRVR
jgi:hypothetical protein